MEKHILTVDVEDNFIYEELVNKEDWQKYESQVVENTLKILHLLRQYKATATFFVVGYVVKRHPEIIEYILKDKHEISSHSYWHKPLNTLSWEEIEKDIIKSKEIIFSIAGKAPLGYRAMGYSIPEDYQRFYSILKENGYIYDSSRKFSEENSLKTVCYRENIYNIFPSFLRIAGRKLIFSGGTYFRLLPFRIIIKGFQLYSKNNQPVMLYVHPWEFNKDQPKRKVSIKQRLLQSPMTFTTEQKLKYLLKKYKFVSIKEYLGI